MKAQETMDAELCAIAALVFQETVLMAAANKLRENQGYAPAYGDGCESDNYRKLQALLDARAKKEEPR
jgi:hypothetical protein